MNELESASWKSDLPGWSPDILPFFDRVAPLLPENGTYVEVGVFFGRSLAVMGTKRSDLYLIAVDPWMDGTSQGYDGPAEFSDVVAKYGSLWDSFRSLMTAHAPDVLERTQIVREVSAIGMKLIPDASVDMVFLDGAHDAQSVANDIREASRILKSGGILSGHDFCGDNGVMEAVRALLGEPLLEPWEGEVRPSWLQGRSTCWSVIVP